MDSELAREIATAWAAGNDLAGRRALHELLCRTVPDPDAWAVDREVERGTVYVLAARTLYTLRPSADLSDEHKSSECECRSTPITARARFHVFARRRTVYAEDVEAVELLREWKFHLSLDGDPIELRTRRFGEQPPKPDDPDPFAEALAVAIGTPARS